jgi:NADH dehydrogenase [ubiquinone] 1 alpha subcomplex assembly factor 6
MPFRIGYIPDSVDMVCETKSFTVKSEAWIRKILKLTVIRQHLFNPPHLAYRDILYHIMMKSDDFTYCARLARERDYGRYLCALSAPATTRHALLTLLAFNDELGKIREIVSEPALGEIRLTWWHETLSLGEERPSDTHPVGRALMHIVETRGLEEELLHEMIDGRRRDLDQMPFATVDELAGYANDTSGRLARVELAVLGIDDQTSVQSATDIAVAWALLGVLRSLPYHERAGRRLLGNKLVRRDILARVDDLLIRARGRAGQASRKAQPVLLLARLCDPMLARLLETGGDPYKANLEFSPLSSVWRVLSGRVTGRF